MCGFHTNALGLGRCPEQLSFQFPLYHNGQFQFVPWVSLLLQNTTATPVPNFAIPTPLHIDNSTLQSLDTTYNTLDQDQDGISTTFMKFPTRVCLQSSFTFVSLLLFAILLFWSCFIVFCSKGPRVLPRPIPLLTLWKPFP